MRIAFVDLEPMDYTPVTPLSAPLGGMQSGVCYLSARLAALGHRVHLLNGTSTPGEHLGVHCERFDPGPPSRRLAEFDVVISVFNDGPLLRRHGAGRRLLLWTGHDTGVASMGSLSDTATAMAWDGFVFKSAWQRDRYLMRACLPVSRCHLIGNAASPLVNALPARERFFFETDRDPVLYYASTPHRGLDLLLKAFPTIRARLPGSVLRVYSSMRVYQRDSEGDGPRRLYAQCRQTDGVEYHGSLPQPALADAIRAADLLAFPSTYPETACITLMDAMSSGCLAVCTGLGALPETAAGFASLLEDTPDRSGDALADRFARRLIASVDEARDDPGGTRTRMLAQIAHARAHYDWDHRAAQWERLLTDLCAQPATADTVGTITENPAPPASPPSASDTAARSRVASIVTVTERRMHVDRADPRGRYLLMRNGDDAPLTSGILRALLDKRRWTHLFSIGAHYGERICNVPLSRDITVLALESDPAVLPFLRPTLSAIAQVRLIESPVDSRIPGGVTLDGLIDQQPQTPDRIRLLACIDAPGRQSAVIATGRQSLRSLRDFALVLGMAGATAADRSWLLRQFAVAGLDLASGRLIPLSSLEPADLAAASIHPDHLVLSRPERTAARPAPAG